MRQLRLGGIVVEGREVEKSEMDMRARVRAEEVHQGKGVSTEADEMMRIGGTGGQLHFNGMAWPDVQIFTSF